MIKPRRTLKWNIKVEGKESTEFLLVVASERGKERNREKKVKKIEEREPYL